MSKLFRKNRKVTDEEILKFNNLGFSLSGIGQRFGCHATSVNARLKLLGVPAVDTRHSFMEEVFQSVPEGTMDMVAEVLMSQSPNLTIKDYVRELIKQDISKRINHV